MGGLFGGAPEPPPPPPPAAAPDPDAEARKQRLDTIARNRRGRLGLIATSDKGVSLDSSEAGGKSLLGD